MAAQEHDTLEGVDGKQQNGSAQAHLRESKRDGLRDEFPERTLWMGDLAPEWSEDDIADTFGATFGRVHVYRPFDSRAAKPAMYAFIRFDCEEHAQVAYDQLNGEPIPGHRGCRFRLNPRWRPRRLGPAPTSAPKRRRSYSPPPDHRRVYTRRRHDSPPPASSLSIDGEVHRLTLWPGRRPGEVPEGSAIGKVLDDYMSRWSRDDDGDEDEWRRAYDDSKREIVAAVVDGETRSRSDIVTDSWRRVAPVLATSLEGYDILLRSVLFIAALAVSIELPGRRLTVMYVPEEGDNAALCRVDGRGVDAAGLESSIRQLIDLDIRLRDVDMCVQDTASQFMRDVEWRRDHAARATVAKVRVGDDVHLFAAPRFEQLVDSTRALRYFNFRLETFDDHSLQLVTADRRPRPSDCSTVAFAALSKSSPLPPEEDPTWAKHHQRLKCIARARDVSLRHGLTSCAAINKAVSGGGSLAASLSAADACFELDLLRLAEDIRGKTILLVAPPGSALPVIARHLAAILHAKGEPPVEVVAEPRQFQHKGLYYCSTTAKGPPLVDANELCIVRCEPFGLPNIDDLNRPTARDLRDLRLLAATPTQDDPALVLADAASKPDGSLRFDLIFSSALPYEINVLKPFVEARLRGVEPQAPEYFRARRLLHILDSFISIPASYLPDNSILKGAFSHPVELRRLFQ